MKCTLAAIDIGSNGARLLIKAFDDEAVGLERVRKLMFVRVPLRLGKDVFTLGKVSKEREEMMIHMMKAYKQLMKVFRVDAYRACATSAMRDAENGMKVIKTIKKESGLDLEVVKGPTRHCCSSTTLWRRPTPMKATSPTSMWAVAAQRSHSSMTARSPKVTPII